MKTIPGLIYLVSSFQILEYVLALYYKSLSLKLNYKISRILFKYLKFFIIICWMFGNSWVSLWTNFGDCDSMGFPLSIWYYYGWNIISKLIFTIIIKPIKPTPERIRSSYEFFLSVNERQLPSSAPIALIIMALVLEIMGRVWGRSRPRA